MPNRMKKIGSWLRRDPSSASLSLRVRRRRPSQLGISINQSSSTTTSILSSLLTLYGLMILMLGVVIPISDALAKPVSHAMYRQLFYIAMLSIGILSITYMSILFWYLDRKRQSAEVKAQDVDADAAEPAVAFSLGSHDGDGESPCLLDQALANGEAEAREEEAEELDSSSTHQEAGSTPDAAAAAEDAEQMENTPRKSQLLQPGHKARREARRRRWVRVFTRNKTAADASVRSGSAQSEHKQPLIWAEGGVNLYLRLGAVVFGFGVMVHDGFKFAEVMEKPTNCHGPLYMPKLMIHLLFIICQTYYIFKYHRVVIDTQRALMRFIMVHLITTNLCIWVKTVVYEIKIGLVHSNAALQHKQQHVVMQRANASAAAAHANATHASRSNYSTYCSETVLADDPSQKLGPYLYPCAVEYGLICAAICYKFFRSIGDHAVVPYGEKGHYQGPRFSTCHKSHKGLFLGLMIMMCILVPLISLVFLETSRNQNRGLYVLVVQSVECVVLVVTTAMAIAGAVTMISQLHFSRVRGNAAFEANLLFVGLAGIVCYNLFVTISVLTCILDSNNVAHCQWRSSSRYYNTKLDGIKSLMEVVQSTVQTFYIMQGIQRKVSLRRLQRLQKPGRGIAMALLIANLAMWVASVFEAKRNISQDFLEVYFGQMPWSIIKYICLPLIIFFRFHSTICLSEIWIHSYKLARSRDGQQ